MSTKTQIGAVAAAPRAAAVPADGAGLSGSGLQRRSVLLGVCSSALLLGACASTAGSGSYTVRDKGFWQGRMALRTEEARPQAQSFGFTLRGSATAGDLEVYSPLGSTLARLVWNDRHAELLTDGKTITDDSLDHLIERIFGTPLPVQALFAWLSGDAVHVPGWQVNLSRYSQGRISAVREQPLPRTHLQVILDTSGQ